MAKTVEITKTMDGCYVTRCYNGQTMGNQFFTIKPPAEADTKKKKKTFLEDQAKAQEAYINEWING